MCSLPQLRKSVCDLPSCEISDYSINSPFHLAGCMVTQPPPYSKLGMEEGDGKGFRETASSGASAWTGCHRPWVLAVHGRGWCRVSQAVGAGYVRWGLCAITAIPKESTWVWVGERFILTQLQGLSVHHGMDHTAGSSFMMTTAFCRGALQVVAPRSKEGDPKSSSLTFKSPLPTSPANIYLLGFQRPFQRPPLSGEQTLETGPRGGHVKP